MVREDAFRWLRSRKLLAQACHFQTSLSSTAGSVELEEQGKQGVANSESELLRAKMRWFSGKLHQGNTTLAGKSAQEATWCLSSGPLRRIFISSHSMKHGTAGTSRKVVGTQLLGASFSQPTQLSTLPTPQSLREGTGITSRDHAWAPLLGSLSLPLTRSILSSLALLSAGMTSQLVKHYLEEKPSYG